MNNIAKRQNEADSISLLAAQRRLYGRAKYAWGLQIAVVVVLPAILVVVDLYYPLSKSLAGFVGLVIAMLDALVFDRIKTAFRKHAAAIQELFDCYVLEVEWPDLKASKPDIEDVPSLAKSVDRLSLYDWYPAEVSLVPFETGRIICQRSNCRWDSKLRSYFGRFLMAFAILLIVASALIAFWSDLRFHDLILGVLAPSLPIILWSIREARTQGEAAERADRLKEYGNKLWEQTRTGSMSSDEARAKSRRFQDEIFEHRVSSPVVFDWFYKLFKTRFEAEMGYSAEQMVKEVRRT